MTTPSVSPSPVAPVVPAPGALAVTGAVAAATPPVSLARAMATGSTNPLAVLVAGGEAERPQLSLDRDARRFVQEKLVLQSGLTDGEDWRSQELLHPLGDGISRLSTNETGAVEAVSVASFDALRLVTETVRTRELALDHILHTFFTERELNDENLGQYRNALNKTKFYSRIAGLLSLKAAIFRAVGLPLPGETGGESLNWTDVEYLRESYTNHEGQIRYRRVRNLQGEIAARLEGKELLTNFTDEGNTGMAIAVVVRDPGQSGIVSLGLDITDLRRFAAPEEAEAHTRGEAAYKATYFGGHQAYYLDNVVGDVQAGETVAEGRVSYTLTGLTGEAMRRLGGREVLGTTVRAAELAGTLMVIRGTPPPGQVSLGNLGAPPETKPLLAQLIDEGRVNVILQYPGNAGEYAAFLLDRFNSDPEARRIILARARVLQEKHGIDFAALVSGEMSPSEMASSAVSQPLIGLAQELVNLELARLGYDFSRGNVVVIGHSQGQLLGLHAIGALSGPEVIDALGLNGRTMEDVQPYFGPQVGDPLDLADFAGIGSEQQLERMLAYTGKISMIATAGITRDDLERIVFQVNRDLADSLDYAKVSLVNIESDPGRYQPLLAKFGAIDLPNDPARNSINVSGTTNALKEIARRVMAGGEGRKVRLLPVTASFHSEVMSEGFKQALPALVGKKLGDLPTAILLNHTGEDLRSITGTVTVDGPSGEPLVIDARVHAVMKGQYLDPVEWPTVVYTAFAMGDPTRPTVVIDGGPGKLTVNMTTALLTDRNGRSLATIIPIGTAEGMRVLTATDPAAIPLVDPRTLTDPNFRPVLPQTDKGPPRIDGEYTGPHGYLSDLHLADPAQRRDLIRRLEKALNLDEGGDPHLHSEFLERLGYDPTMPLNVAAMTGNNRVELVSAMAADRYLCFYAVTTVGFDFAALAVELDAIHERTKERLREKGVANWEKGAPFGANLIHGTGSYKRQIQEIIAAKKRGVPINVVSVAFSKIELAEWNEFYQPLLDEGITIVPLGENENRWDHFLNNIFPDVPEHQRHLLAIAPEGGEGGGHNVSEKSEAIRYGRDLTRSLLQRGGMTNQDSGIEVPWLMTGGESTPEALADALLVMAGQKVRGGMQIGGAMQIALESAPPPQVKRFIAEAMAGNGSFEQVDSEFDRRINLVANKFSRRLVEISEILADLPAADAEIEVRDPKQVSDEVQGTRRGRIVEIAKGAGTTEEKIAAIQTLWGEMQQDPKKRTTVKVQAAIGTDRARRIAEIILQEPLPMRQVLHRMWIAGLNDFNFTEFAPLLSDGWDLWLADDPEPLAAKLATLTRTDIIRLFRSYRTWAINEPDCDPDGAYVLGGRSIRAMGRSLEAEGRDPRAYLMKSGPEIFRDLRERTIRYMKDLYARATALEEAEQDRYAVTDVEAMRAIPGVTVVSDEPLVGGENKTVRLKLGKGLDADQWKAALLSAGHGNVARVLRTEGVGGGEKDNPIHRTLIAEAGDQVELIRRLESGQLLLEGVRIFDKSGRLVAEIKPNADHTVVEETWHLEQKGGVDPSPVAWRYEIRTGIVGNKKVVLVAGETAQQGRAAYTTRWVGADVRPTGTLGDPVTTEPFEVTANDVLTWNKEIGTRSRAYTDTRQPGGVKVHPTFPLRAAWRSMMLAGMHPDADVDYLKVIHSGQTQRFGAPVRVGDRLTATSQITKVENNPQMMGTTAQGREVTIFTQVVNQAGELVAEYETKFLSRVTGLETKIVFDRPVTARISQPWAVIPLERPLTEVYRHEGISLRRSDITGYSIDDQWLHTNDRFARRVGFKNGIIAQGWRLLHTVAHSVVEGYLGNDSSRFIGFGEGTAVTGAVLPGERLTLEVNRVAVRGDREILSFKLSPADGGEPKAAGTIELKASGAERLPAYGGFFPGNASQKVGMARALYTSGGTAATAILDQATKALGDDEGTLLLDVITDGASIPSGNTARQAALDKAKSGGWLNDVVNSSPAVMATSLAYYAKGLADGVPLPAFVGGHSLGQYTAAVAAGAILPEDGMRLVRRRGELLKQHAPGKIAAVSAKKRLTAEELEERLAKVRREGEVLQVANINNITDGASQIVISGDEAAIQRAGEKDVLGDDLKVTVLPGNVAFHSSKVQAMETEFRAVIDGISIQDPQIPMMSIVTPGRILRSADEVKEELIALNHSPVQWDPAVRGLNQGEGVKVSVEFGAGTTLTSFNGRILPAGSLASSASQVEFADELLFGKRPEPEVVEEAPPPPPPPAETRSAAAAGAVEPTPVSYSSSDMAVLDLRLTSARVVLDKGAIASATVSPLAPPLGASVSQFVWANMILTLCETFPGKIKPAEIRPETRLVAEIGFDSLELAVYFGLVRNRNGIARMPTDDEVKALEQGTMADAFKLIVAYWDHPGEKPDIKKIGPPLGTPGKTYKEILDAAGIKGEPVFRLVMDGKLTSKTAGLQARLVQPILGEASEGAVAGVVDHLARVKGWKYTDNFATQAKSLREVRERAYALAGPLWEQKKKDREARNRAAQAAAGVSVAGAAVVAAVDPEQIREEATRAAADLIRKFVREHGAPKGDGAVVRPLEFDPNRGVAVPVGEAVAAENARVLAAVAAETSPEFVKMLSTPWSGRLHPAWGEVEQNGAAENLLTLFAQIAAGELDPDSEFGEARILLLANQVDKLRVDLAIQLADLAKGRGLEKVEKGLRLVAEAGIRSIAEGGLPQPIVWESTRMVPDPTTPGGIREVSRGMTPSQVLDQWEREELVDPKTIADLRAMTRGEVSYKGRKVLIYGGTGTISRPTVEFFMELGAEVWVTTRQNFGASEKWAREIRNRHAVRGNSLRVSTGFEPNYSNIAALRAQHEEQNWKPDIIINGMAADDYGPITEKLDFHKVTHVLVDSFRYAVGRYIDWYKKDPANSPTFTVVDQDSPNNNFAIKFSGSYPFAKAAMPSGQWAQRRETEGLRYPDGRPIYREAAVLTGAVVPLSARGIMGDFRRKGDAIERAARAEGRPLWMFNGRDMGVVNVAICNPRHGVADQNDRLADGGFKKMGGRPGGLQALMDEVAAKPAEPAAAATAKTTKAPEYHPFVDGQFRAPTSFGFFIDEIDGETDGTDGAQNPYSEIADDDLVIVGADMATTFGPDAISSFVNLLETVGGFEGPWGQHLGLLWTAKLMGLDVKGKSPAEVHHLFGAEIYANMGARPLVADNGQRADAYRQLQLYEGEDEIRLATWQEFEEAREGTDDAHQQLRQKVADLHRSGYTFTVEKVWDNDATIPDWKEVVVARKPDATLAREVTIQVGPQIVADLPPIDWVRAGAEQVLIDSHARHVMATQMVVSGAAQKTGLVPHDLTARHGAEEVHTVVSSGMGGLNLLRDQQQNPREGRDPGERAVVYGIPAAAAGRVGQDIFGAKGPCTETPGACNTGPTSVWHAKQYFEAASQRARKAREQANQETDTVQKTVLEMEAKRLEEFAEDMVVVISSGDNGATVETNMLFERVGAMLTQRKAEAKEFPDGVQQRPHDKDRIPGFQSGVGFGGLVMVRGRAMKKYGYTPLAVLRATDIGSDGPRSEPDGKTRAPTGLGRWGQRKVFFRALREARMGSLPQQDIEQMNSHSTGTGGDSAQSESFFVAAAGEAVDWAVKVIAAGGTDRYPKFAARLAAAGVSAQDLAKNEDWEATLKQVGLSVGEPEVMMEEVVAWGLEERQELGLAALRFENHPKGAGFRHTLGGTIIEFITLLMQTTERVTLPNPGLNNVIDSTGQSPVATTLPNVTDLKPILGAGANYRTRPAEAPRKRRGMAQNSFGFNGLDGFMVAEVPEGMHFKTVSEARKWFADNIRTYVRAVALYRARNDDQLPAILPYEIRMDTPQLLYADTKEAYERAEEYAAKIVAREEVEFPWEKAHREAAQKAAAPKAA